MSPICVASVIQEGLKRLRLLIISKSRQLQWWVLRLPDIEFGAVVQVMEVDAFCSVHDMIHAAILSYGCQASLREVRLTRTCRAARQTASNDSRCMF